jgi:hypothetical protein
LGIEAVFDPFQPFRPDRLKTRLPDAVVPGKGCEAHDVVGGPGQVTVGFEPGQLRLIDGGGDGAAFVAELPNQE